jgi:hypothetical protein
MKASDREEKREYTELKRWSRERDMVNWVRLMLLADGHEEFL